MLCFVLMVCWNQHMASVEMYIFSVSPALITCWNICISWLFWVGMHQWSLSIPDSGASYLITKLYSLKYKVSHVWCMWVTHEFHAIFTYQVASCCKFCEKWLKKPVQICWQSWQDHFINKWSSDGSSGACTVWFDWLVLPQSTCNGPVFISEIFIDLLIFNYIYIWYHEQLKEGKQWHAQSPCR